MNTITCTTSQHPTFTVGKAYEIINGTFGPMVADDKGNKVFVGRTFKHITSLYLDTFVTTFKKD